MVLGVLEDRAVPDVFYIRSSSGRLFGLNVIRGDDVLVGQEAKVFGEYIKVGDFVDIKNVITIEYTSN